MTLETISDTNKDFVFGLGEVVTEETIGSKMGFGEENVLSQVTEIIKITKGLTNHEEIVNFDV